MPKAKPIFYLFILSCSFLISKISWAQSEPFTARTVASGFNSAWEVTYGPNDSLWVTESRRYRVQRVNIANGTKTTLLDLVTGGSQDAAIEFSDGGNYGGRPAPTLWPQGGLMGLAIHPALYSSDPTVRAAKPWVYIVYVYQEVDCPNNATHCTFKSKIVRYDYRGNALTNPTIVLDNIPGSSDHNSGRLTISPIEEPGVGGGLNTQYRLYYTIGDMGAGQFANVTRTENAQNIDVLEGKVLRLNTETDGDAGLDAWAPDDNPYYQSTSITARDYVYSYGHRNAQGLVWGVLNGNYKLFSSEQMDKTDDEINIIEPGSNYGWDQVSGYCDGNVNGYKIGRNNSANEQVFCNNVANANAREPIFTVFTATAAQMPTVNSQPNSQWPTIACSSIDFISNNKIPDWYHSLLITSLKRDKVYRIKPNLTGTGVVPLITGDDTISYFRNEGDRVRDIAISPDGLRFYVARDAGASVNGGAIREYAYTGVVLALGDDNKEHPKKVKDMVKVYPNPVDNIVIIQGKKELPKPLRVQLLDITGRLRLETISFKNEFSIDLSLFQKGVYFLKLYNGNGQEVQVEKLVRR